MPATLVGVSGNILRAQFDPLTLQEEEALTMVLYSRADTWLGWGETREADKPLTSLGRIFKLAWHGLEQTILSASKPAKTVPKGKLATSIVPLLILALLFSAQNLSAQVRPFLTAQLSPQVRPSAVQRRADALPAMAPTSVDGSIASSSPVAPGTFDNVMALSDIGVPDTIVMHGIDAYSTVRFSLPQTQIVKTATMHLRYHFSPGLIPSLSHLKVSLNGTLFATIPVTTPPSGVTQPSNGQASSIRTENNALLESVLTLPAEMLVHDNELTFEFVGHYTLKCEDPSHSTLWAHIDNNSTIELAGSLHPVARRPQAPARALLRLHRQSPSGNPDRLPHAAFTQGSASGRHRRILVRHPRRLSPDALSRLRRRHPLRQRHRYRRERREPSFLASDERNLRPHHRHADQSL